MIYDLITKYSSINIKTLICIKIYLNECVFSIIFEKKCMEKLKLDYLYKLAYQNLIIYTYLYFYCEEIYFRFFYSNS